MTSFPNPMQTDGFEFVEFATRDPKTLDTLFKQLDFVPVAQHKSKAITLYQQGDIRFLVNAEPNSFASRFEGLHGPSACGMAFRVKDAQFAFERAVQLGAKPVKEALALGVPAIYGIGDLALYFIDGYATNSTYTQDFAPLPNAKPLALGQGLCILDHLTHNLPQGAMTTWANYYERLFNFREIRYFDIEGEFTGLFSRALTAPCNKIRIPLNEPKDDNSQIAEYLRAYNGPGIQHIALTTDNIYSTIEKLKDKGVKFLTTPDTYYERIDVRVPGHKEDLARLKKNQILIDGDVNKSGILLQIFTQNAIGPIFFEIIQRKGNEGFGEGNFKALFVSMEEDQIRRGVLKRPNGEVA